MIGRLRGEVLESSGGMVLVDVGGVGYEVLVPDSVLAQIPPPGETVDLRIRQIFREDGVSLYGFLDAFQRRLFDLLREVKGCGPRIGLALLGQLGEHEVMNAILVQDARILARATGVGPKLAERILLELRTKIQEEAMLQKVGGQAAVRAGGGRAVVEDELIDALLALGYRRPEAEAAAEKARDEAETVEEQIRAALRTLRR
ncbi:MAG: Holliday junction branch migration protein RuvA [Fimbriimonadaceae bacterium]|nr:Holliday junction branch migration protein RuvA [Chthonomonadaceae bacterium]MCO5296741.1 Holliday junction branch migration protein RuvA [Fimbriimonadaceae bacterium]